MVTPCRSVTDLNALGADGEHALIAAVRSGQKEYVAWLADAGAHLNKLSDTGKNALHVACQLGKYTA